MTYAAAIYGPVVRGTTRDCNLLWLYHYFPSAAVSYETCHKWCYRCPVHQHCCNSSAVVLVELLKDIRFTRNCEQIIPHNNSSKCVQWWTLFVAEWTDVTTPWSLNEVAQWLRFSGYYYQACWRTHLRVSHAAIKISSYLIRVTSCLSSVVHKLY